jgi:hypothetical protein
MNEKISDLSVEEFRTLIIDTVNETMEHFFEDAEALRSESFISSIEAARADYASGKVNTLEQAFGSL